MQTCFLCASPVVKSEVDLGQQDNVKVYLETTCKLLEISGIYQRDWASLNFCLKCSENLKAIHKTYELLARTQEKLNRCLKNVETVIAKTKTAADLNWDSTSAWGESRDKFRDGLLTRQRPSVLEEDPIRASVSNDESTYWEHDWREPSDDGTQLEDTKQTETRRGGKRKRKLVVIAEEDEEDTQRDVKHRSKRTRISKKQINDDDWVPEPEPEDIEEDFERDEGDVEDEGRKRKKLCAADKLSGKWITCRISNCTRRYNRKSGWLSHARKCHRNVDLEKHWTSGDIMLLCRYDNCNQEIGNKFKFKEHIKTAHPKHLRSSGNKPVICDMCRLTVQRTEIGQHCRDHVGEYALPCANRDCFRVFCTLSAFHNHLQNVLINCGSVAPPNWKFDTCQVCSFKTSNPRILQSHLKIMHESESSKNYPCPVSSCTQKYTHRQSVYLHISQCHTVSREGHLMVIANSAQQCSICKQTFSLDEIVNHFETSHDASPDSITSCKYCPFQALSRGQLLDHFSVHFRSGIRVSCDICPEETKFQKHDSLRRHYLDEHRIGETFICEHCSKQFSQEYGLKTHLKLYHSGVPTPQRRKNNFKCPQCPEEAEGFTLQTDLVRHQINVHGAEPFKCSTCEKSFSSWESYQAHIKLHTGERSMFKCDIPGCTITCHSKAALALHKKSVVHVGRTNEFRCDICGMGFNMKNGLKSHRERVHVAERKYVCDVCGSGFKSKRDLQKHGLIHTGELPFQCDMCEKRFRQKPHLTAHLRSHYQQ